MKQRGLFTRKSDILNTFNSDKNNLIGQRFGKLVVSKSLEPHTSPCGTKVKMWLCECDCGKKTKVTHRNLMSGNTKTCGCSQRNDLNGKRFGMLTCVEPTKKRKNRSILWKCKCDCGNEILVQADYLKEYRFSSCGCNNIVDISNKKFGRLTAMKPTKERTKYGSVVWECKCDCGEICFVSGNSLRNNGTKSCGCVQREKQMQNINKLLENECVEKTMLCNLTNQKRKDNTSGHKGVYWVQRVEMWRVCITFQGKTHNIGYFKDFDKAVIAREEAEEKYFKPILEKYGRNIENN